MHDALSPREFHRLLAEPAGTEQWSALANAPGFVVVDLRGSDHAALEALPQPACVVIGLARGTDRPAPGVVDVLADEERLESLTRSIGANPIAARVLVQVVRHNEWANVADGLLAESLAYSTLQHGSGFIDWLARRGPPHASAGGADPLELTRDGETLRITLDQPARRNAYSSAMRDALCAALDLVLADITIRKVVIDGRGPAFCAGGDLNEFGMARDAAVAHVSRTTRNAGALLHRLRDRVECHVHGACIGAGIELPAFAGRLVARRDAFFQLPEVGMGLVPGAGGTVSITKRIGRLRTAAFALSGDRIDADSALAWGLVDAVVENFG
jgi:enoyl-CoA hydratase